MQREDHNQNSLPILCPNSAYYDRSFSLLFYANNMRKVLSLSMPVLLYVSCVASLFVMIFKSVFVAFVVFDHCSCSIKYSRSVYSGRRIRSPYTVVYDLACSTQVTKKHTEILARKISGIRILLHSLFLTDDDWIFSF